MDIKENENVKENESAEEIAERCAQRAGELFKHGLSCSECVFKAWLDEGISGYPPETLALSSGMGGGMGASRHTCGAVNAGMLVIGTKKGRKDPFATETFEERVNELNDPENGVYAVHGAYIKEVITEWGSIECRDMCFPFDMQSKERKRNCKKIIMDCTRAAVMAALK